MSLEKIIAKGILPFIDIFNQKVSEKYGIDKSFINSIFKDIFQIKSINNETCIEILKSGKRKGDYCGNKVVENSRCNRHKHLFNSERKKIEPIDTSLHLTRDNEKNITFHKDTGLVIEKDTVVGKIIDGEIKKINETLLDKDDIELTQKRLLSILGINDNTVTDTEELDGEFELDDSDIDQLLTEIKN